MKIQAISAITVLLYGLSGTLQVAGFDGSRCLEDFPENTEKLWYGDLQYDQSSEHQKYFSLEHGKYAVTVSTCSELGDNFMRITNKGPATTCIAVDSNGRSIPRNLPEGGSTAFEGRRFKVWLRCP